VPFPLFFSKRKVRKRKFAPNQPTLATKPSLHLTNDFSLGKKSSEQKKKPSLCISSDINLAEQAILAIRHIVHMYKMVKW
jgi:hypothetical protein